MVLVVIAWLTAAACIFVCVRRVGRVNAFERDTAAADGLERASRARLLDKLGTATTLGRTVHEAFAAPSRAAGIALLNETLADIARELDVGREVPRGAGRIALAVGGFTGLVELARRLPAGGVGALPTALAAFGAGAVGVVVCGILGRSAERAGRLTKDRWNAVVRLIDRELAERPAPSPNVGNSRPIDA